MNAALDLLRDSPFFDGLGSEHVEHFVRQSRTERFERGDRIITQGKPAEGFYVLMSGKLELSFRKTTGEIARNEDSAVDPVEHTPPHVVSRPGYPVGWSSVVEPYRYRATATALSRTEMLVIERNLLEAYAYERPDFGLEFMKRVLWLMSGHLRMTRTRLVANLYGSVPRSIRALLEQNTAMLSVSSPLHKIPHYLENRLTLEDALRTLHELEQASAEVERELAAQIADLLYPAWQELKLYQKLQAIYELVASASTSMSPAELRRRSSAAFADLFADTDHLILGEENLPEESGHIVVMNHLSNHRDNLFPNHFILTLDTHFVSSMILSKRYGEPPVRVVRKSDPGEYGHQKYFDRLGYIYVYSGHVDPADGDPYSSPEERRRLFLDSASSHLHSGRNIVICPEGTSAATENSPLPFKAGAFSLASYVRPEPLIIPIAVANFDKKLTRTRTVAVVHEPIRLSEHLGHAFERSALHDFVNNDVYTSFQGYVREAVEMAR